MGTPRDPYNALEGLVGWISPIAVLFFTDQFLAACFSDAGWSFPSSIFGLLLVLAALLLLNEYRRNYSKAVHIFFQPALTWVHRWLPLFYLAPLVNLPGELAQLSRTDLLGMLAVVAFGWVANLWVTVKMTLWIRAITRRDVQDHNQIQPSRSTPMILVKAWATIAVFSLPLLMALTGSAISIFPRIVFSLSITVSGLFLGNKLHNGPLRFLHPIVTCAIIAHLGAGLGGIAEGIGWHEGVRSYLPKEITGVGTGSILMLFLGSVVLSFAFEVYAQRSTMVHHFWEISLGIATSSLFSIFSTIAIGRLLGMQPEVILALSPRSVTVALALPMANALGSQLTTITAGGVVLTGLLGANFSQKFLDWFGAVDPIVRGVSSASCGHGLATAAMSSNEPNTLAYCSLAYVLAGVLGTVIVQLPFASELIAVLAGDDRSQSGILE